MSNITVIQLFLNQILNDNQDHMRRIDPHEYKKFEKIQTPRATVVMCSDSRVQSEAFRIQNVNDLFIVRNIGNQIVNSSGSIEFGIRFLKTPVLLIVGHSGCGAIEAVVNNVDVQNGCIERELEPIDVEGSCLNDAILQNVHNQIKIAMKKFSKLVGNNELVIIGAVYDFQNAYAKGLGRLIIINVNGEKDPNKILENSHFKDVPNVITMLNT